MSLFTRFRGSDTRSGSEYGADFKPLGASDIDLQKTGLPSLDLHIGGDERHLIRFEDVGSDWSLAPRARDLALALIQRGVTNPYEIYDKVSAFAEEERAKEPPLAN